MTFSAITNCCQSFSDWVCGNPKQKPGHKHQPTRIDIQTYKADSDSKNRDDALSKEEYSEMASRSDHKVREVSSRELSKSEQKS